MNTSSIKRRDFVKNCGLALAGLSAGGPYVLGSPGKKAEDESAAKQRLPHVSSDADFIVVGGGVAGVCSAITAARGGLKVVLIQDRPVLGGNASSEVRLWVLGATAHMGNNNRWAREGGVLDELLVENMHRNKEGNPIFFDALLIEKVWAEPNITLLLNTSVYDIEMDGSSRIRKVIAFCSQNSTHYEYSAPYFCDASGDGIVGFLAGAKYRMGAETAEEFGEKFIMPADYGKLLGHSMYFYSKDAGYPVKYVAPAFALKDIPKKIPRYKKIYRSSSGCRLWWLEWGDELDRVYDSEQIRDELWRVVYGVWDYIKNSGEFKDVDNLTLEWASTIPGKRESRRFEGDYMLKQQDIIKQQSFDDAIAYGGWAIDLHPSRGVYSAYPGCTQYHSKGVYTIPYRCIYSKNISNLFMAGRIISASHVAFGSTRVICTGTLCGQAAALAAAICVRNKITPREVYSKGHIKELQQALVLSGQYMPGLKYEAPEDLVSKAKLSVDAALELAELPQGGTWCKLDKDCAMLIPFAAGKIPQFTFSLDAETSTTLGLQLCLSGRHGNYTPDQCLAKKELQVTAGKSSVNVDFAQTLEKAQYGFVILKKNKKISVAESETRLTGLLSLRYSKNQKASAEHGVEEIPLYVPMRRPGGKNLAMKISPPLKSFSPAQLVTGVFRPANGLANAWLAPLEKQKAQLNCEWTQPQRIKKIILWFDADYDHPMESCLLGHPESTMPFCVAQYIIRDDRGNIVYETSENHQARNEIALKEVIQTSRLTIELTRNHENVPISLFGIQAFG